MQRNSKGEKLDVIIRDEERELKIKNIMTVYENKKAPALVR